MKLGLFLTLAIGLPILGTLFKFLTPIWAAFIIGGALGIGALTGQFGKTRAQMMGVAGIGVILLAVFSPNTITGLTSGLPTTSAVGQTQQLTVPSTSGFQASLAEACADTRSSTPTFNAHNDLNTTDTTYNTVVRLYKLLSDGGEEFATVITDTTAGTATLDCGFEYIGRGISQNSDVGNNSKFLSTKSNNLKIENGNLRFSISSANPRIEFGGSQHGIPEFRMFDELNNGFMFDNDDGGVASAFEAANSVFMSTTDNATTLAVGAGGEVDVTIEMRSTRTETDFNDRGLCMLVDSATSIWDVPTVKVDGVSVPNSKGSLSTKTQQEWGSIFEYAYCWDKPVQDTPKTLISYNQFALSGVNPGATDNINFTFITKGNFLSIDGVTTLTDFADDTSGVSPVYTEMDILLDVS